jgi:hypothetical protein
VNYTNGQATRRLNGVRYSRAACSVSAEAIGLSHQLTVDP